MKISDMILDTDLTGAEFVPIVDPNEILPSRRNKRVLLSDIFGQTGPQGPAGLSAYQVWLVTGHSGTQADFFASLQGPSGTSAYQAWLNLGNVGTITQFIESLKGTPGESAYQLWISLGNVGTPTDFIFSLMGPAGPIGPIGSLIFYGSGAPNNTLGNNNDYYIDIDSGFLYQKSTDSWVGPILDMRGQDGNNILTGFTQPDDIDGIAGDYYLNLANGDFYGPKTTVWLSTPTANIRGPSGNDGSQGNPGLPGIPGSNIYNSSGIPNESDGIAGDYYINNDNGDLYRKSFIGWNSPIFNLKGFHGSTWYNGPTLPSDLDGINGDYYLNITTGDIYTKTLGIWDIPIANITGPIGISGIQGNGVTFTNSSFNIVDVNSTQDVELINIIAFPIGTYCAISDGVNSLVGLIVSYALNVATIQTVNIVLGVVGNTVGTNATVTFSGPQGPTSASVNTLSDLTDVNVNESSLINGYSLVYDSAVNKWVASLATSVNSGAENDDLLKHWFPPSGNIAISGSASIVGDPFLIYDNDNNQWIMFYYRAGVSTYYVTASTLEGPWSSETQITSLDNYHQLSFLLDISGKPVRLNGNYHAYATFISGGISTTKEIFHFTCTDLTGPFTLETKVIEKGLTGSYDGAYADSPFVIFDGAIIRLWYSAAPDTSQIDFTYSERLLLATASDPDGPFIKDYLIPALNPSTISTDFDYGWIGGGQIILRPNGKYLMFYTAGNTIPISAGEQPDTALVGVATSDSLDGPWVKSNINPYLSIDNLPDIFPDNTNIFRSHAAYDENMQRWYLFYSTGTDTDQNITFSRIDEYSLIYNPSPINGFGNVQNITSSEVQIFNSSINVSPGLYRVRGQFNLISNNTDIATNPLNIAVYVRLNGTQVNFNTEFVGSYSYENRDSIIEVQIPVVEKSIIDFSTIVLTGTPDAGTYLRNSRISIERLTKGQVGKTGYQGIRGFQGLTGLQGPQGLKGQTGTIFYNGVGLPNDSLGVDDDYYINTINGNFYQKQTGVYVLIGSFKGPIGLTGITGNDGVDGSIWYNGSIIPNNSLGNDNDYYLLVTTGDVYNRQSGIWVIIGNIRGPSSENGSPPLITLDTYANRTPSPVIGALHKCTDIPIELYSSVGTTYDKFIHKASGQIITPYDDSSAVWYNQASSQKTLIGPLTRLEWPQGVSGNDVSIRAKSLASSTPYSKKIYFKPTFPAVQTLGCGLGLYSSITGRAIMFGITGRNPQSTSGVFNSPNGFSLDVVKFTDLQGNVDSDYYVQSSPVIGEGIWLNIEDDGLNRFYRYSIDGQTWYNIVVTTNTDYITPNFIGLLLYQNNQIHTSDAASMLILSSDI